MKPTYNHRAVEKKWHDIWEEHPVNVDDGKKEKYYCLDMFPYPSGSGLHVGHWRGYVISDVWSRYKLMQGYYLIHPMGWDAFGLPAENYAIKMGVHPARSTAENIANIKRQIKQIAAIYDWDREVNTTDPDFYKWTQWIFVKMFKNGLAYEKEMPINWCPSCKTGLANEEVVNGKCERCGTDVTKKNLKQWMLKITAYADRLLDDLKTLDWPEKVVKMQTDWIGKSYGAEIGFKVAANGLEGNSETVKDADGNVLKEGTDYTVSYSANKKVGTNTAKYTFKFLGNFKGTKAAAGTFSIVPASLADLHEDGLVQVAAVGKTVKKAGVYKTVPYVSVNGTALKKSDMILTYYIDEEMTKEMTKATPVEVGGTVYVKIVGKGNYAAKDAGDFISTVYKVVNVDKTKDLSKAKIVDAKTGKALGKQEYTGEEIQPEIKVMIGATEVPEDAYALTYVNNVNKGKATVIITAVDDNEGGYAGSKAQNFNIASRNLKNVVDFFKDLFS